jgi:hypothetical protein
MIAVVLIAGFSLFLACGASVLIGAARASDQVHPASPVIIQIGIFY